MRKLDKEIADTANAAEKIALRDRRATIVADHDAKIDEELTSEDMGRLEEWETENRLQA